ncbi:MAG: hemin-degrading factor, partial [Chloroflexota bacterium]|nr:hemin-degrading factor [Chloroflexota bacterium]
AEAASVRALVRALEREGLSDAEQLVRRDREGLGPEVATRLLERRLDALLDDIPEDGRETVRALVHRVAAVLTVEGTRLPAPLPGWLLVETGTERQSSNRRITLPE